MRAISFKYRLLIPPVAGFLAYGAWAVFINYSHGWDLAVKAGLTQGGYSFCITLILGVMIEWLFARLARTPLPLLLRGLCVFFLSFSLLVVTSYSLNYWLGTPELILTILPGLLMSAMYTALYIFTLSKSQ